MKANAARDALARHYGSLGTYYLQMLKRMAELPALTWAPREMVRRRYVQEVLYHSLSEKLRHEDTFQHFNPRPNELRPTLRFTLLFIAKFVVRAYQLYAQLLLTPAKVAKGPAVLVYGLPPSVFANPQTIRDCAQYFQARLGGHFIEIQGGGDFTDDLCEVSREPLVGTFAGTNPTIFERFALIACGLWSHVKFLCTIVMDRRVALLQRDFLFLFLVRHLNERRLIANVGYTNSLYDRQELYWTALTGRHFGLHMFWYSANNFGPCFYIDATGHPVHPGYPAFMLMTYDQGWYWDHVQCQFFTRMMGAHQHGDFAPILFKELPRSSEELRPNKTAVLFDVLPFTKEWAQGYGLNYYYYEVATLERFLNDCLEVLTQQGFTVSLKTKRKTASVHQGSYATFLADLVVRYPNFSLLDSEADVADVLRQAELAISIPFTSPTVVAAYQGIPAAFYDPTGELVPIHDPLAGITFLGSPDALSEWIATATSCKPL